MWEWCVQELDDRKAEGLRYLAVKKEDTEVLFCASTCSHAVDKEDDGVSSLCSSMLCTRVPLFCLGQQDSSRMG